MKPANYFLEWKNIVLYTVTIYVAIKKPNSHPISKTKAVNRQFHNKRQSLMVSDKQAANYLTDQNNFTGHMFNIKLEEKS